MNFNDAKSDQRMGSKMPDVTSDEPGKAVSQSSLDKSAMESATKAQRTEHSNEQTNAMNNTIFSK